LLVLPAHLIIKEVMRRSRTTQYETEGDMAMFTFSPAVSDEGENCDTVPFSAE
jgi:hypothetical protein